jgi:hypothetical protein
MAYSKVMALKHLLVSKQCATNRSALQVSGNHILRMSVGKINHK